MPQSIIMIVLFMVMFSQSPFAQKGLEITATLTPGFSTILNKEDLQRIHIDEYQLSLGFEGKVTVGHNFTNHLGIATGLGITYLEQNYIRPETKDLIKPLQHTSDRQFSYLRVPVLFKIESHPKAPNGFFMRFGPHIDILMMAIGTTQFPLDHNRPDAHVNYHKKVEYNGQSSEIFQSAVLGASIEMGVTLSLTDQFSLLILGHFETTITNVDGDAAPDYFASTQQAVRRGATYLDIDQRSQTFNLMGGLSIGMQYKLNSYGNSVGRGRKMRGYRTHKWN